MGSILDLINFSRCSKYTQRTTQRRTKVSKSSILTHIHWLTQWQPQVEIVMSDFGHISAQEATDSTSRSYKVRAAVQLVAQRFERSACAWQRILHQSGRNSSKRNTRRRRYLQQRRSTNRNETLYQHRRRSIQNCRRAGWRIHTRVRLRYTHLFAYLPHDYFHIAQKR